MKQRKTIARKENFLTGEVIELEKFKPYNQARAVHTIELFDAKTGELVERTTSENFISKNIEAIQKIYALVALFSLQAEGNDSSFLLNQGWNNDTYSFSDPAKVKDFQRIESRYNSPLRYLVLTNDDSKEEPEKETLLKGDLIGWADRMNTYSGNDTKQGTINTVESYAEHGHLHLVFDWPTHAANGTFNSVNFASEYEYNNYNYWLGYKYKSIEPPENYFFSNSGFSNSGFGCKVKDGKLYIPGYYNNDLYSQYIFVYDIDLENFEIATENPQIYNTEAINNDYLYSFDIAPDGSIWYTDSAARLWHYGKDGQRLPIPGISGNYLQTGGSFNQGMVIVGNELWVETGTGANPILTRYSLNDFSEPLDVRELTGGPALNRSYDFYLDYIPELNLIAVKGNYYIHFYDRGTYSFKQNTPMRAYVDNKYAQKFYFHQGQQTLAHLQFYESNSYWGAYFRFAGNLGARNLLPNTVTKTSQNTMKLTYDLYIDF